MSGPSEWGLSTTSGDYLDSELRRVGKDQAIKFTSKEEAKAWYSRQEVKIRTIIVAVEIPAND